MGRQDFDNIMKYILVRNLNVGNTTVSVEVDLELPRGFIAKIFMIIFEWIDQHEDTEGIALEFSTGVEMTLLRDPDETLTTRPVSNAVQTDVMAQAGMTLSSGQNLAAELTAVFSEFKKIIQFPEHIDVITARNMRFNSRGVGPDVALLTESLLNCEIYYTLEEVNDKQILDL